MQNFQTSLPQKQRGASKLGILMAFLMIVAFLTVGLKVGPLYVDNNIVVSYSESLMESGEAANLSPSELRNKVSDNLRMNNVQDFDVSSIKLTRENSEPVITIDYERRIELFLNLDVVAKFNTVLK